MVPAWLLITGAVVAVLGGILLVLVRFTDLVDRWFNKPGPDPRVDPDPLITDPLKIAQEMHKIEEEQARARTSSKIEYGLLLVLVATIVALVAVSVAGPESIPPTTTLP